MSQNQINLTLNNSEDDDNKNSLLVSILITLAFVFGPIVFIIDLFFPSLFDWLNYSKYIFALITLIFFISAIISAKPKDE